jgi:hypothetical protein
VPGFGSSARSNGRVNGKTSEMEKMRMPTVTTMASSSERICSRSTYWNAFALLA